MLSGEERWKTTIPTTERWKTTICLSSKKATCRCSTLFLYISLSLFCKTTTWNSQKRLSYTRSQLLHGGNIVRVLVHFFFSLPFIFTLHWWPVAFLIFSPPLQNCHVVLPTKRCLLFCLSLTLNLCRPFSRWASLACRLLSFLSLSFSCSIFQICGHDN